MPYTTKPNKVVIIGGGIAGLTTAHELIERGFEVTVYERGKIPGGKSRSMYVPGSGKEGRANLPAEHGFRFFPGFYRHVIDSMKRIPFGDNPNGVYDNLIGLKETESTRKDGPPVTVPISFPNNPLELPKFIMGAWRFREMGLDAVEAEMFVKKIWQIWTSSKLRDFGEYESISWWDYIEADGKSEKFKNYLAKGMTTQLVASKPKLASTRSVAGIGFKLVFDSLQPGGSADRVLNGPSAEVWIQPWVDHIRDLGVNYKLEHEAIEIVCKNAEIKSIKVRDIRKNREFTEEADYYVIATPVEKTVKLLTPEILAADPHLQYLFPLTQMTEWMNGIMFYLNTIPEVVRGHVSYLDSAWALTSVNQQQLWDDYNLKDYGDGKVRDILSVVISNWSEPGELYGKSAMESTPEEIKEEVWHQIKTGLNSGEKEIISDDMLESWYLDPDIVNSEDNPHKNTNLEPLLVNLVDSWRLRPNSKTKVKNMYLAADYVRTNTDVATMESANEAGRRAANHIIDASGISAKKASIWDWERPWYFQPFTWYDAWRFKRGLSWKAAPSVVTVTFRVLQAIDKLFFPN